ncbi:tripartite tricarboxylate transporter substrate-binding protein [Roseiarcaceae bacterium H3SJ34-1]|uniref:Bug family tripartite tricarboxylate transporter substrate binding protein n=1 Tax=Terripilifer ovatus TaxID=3032367 RepID=UPI003AB98306|nr:tripartite tricarboxylate transporter substrate-binding protein [Roseiarcaceae bacterium H3SJ34-1]
MRFAPATALFAVLATGSVHADPIDEFYHGRTMSIVVGHEPGTGFDLYSRSLARHMSRFVPGTPTIVVQNMVGASGLNAISWLYSVAPKDGSVIAISAHTAPLEPLLGSGVAKFDASRFNWIGNIDHGVSVCGVWHTSGIATFDDVFKKEILLGGTGASGPLSSAANALRNLLGAKIKLVDGYKGSASIRMATLQGEVNGVCGISLSTLNAQYGQDVRDGRFKPILQFGTVESPALPGVPAVYRYARTDEDRQTFDLVFGAQSIGRAYAAPPDTPLARVQALRAAFMKTMEDPAFAAELEKQQLDLNPRSGEELQELFNSLFRSPRAVVERARAATKSAVSR